MKNIQQKVQIIINGFFTIVLLIHVLLIGENLMFPGNPNVRVERKDLKDIKFPLAFKLCVSSENDVDEFANYQKFGYTSSYNFFRGVSLFNESMRGWNGHTRNHSILGSVKGQYKIKFLLENI